MSQAQNNVLMRVHGMLEAEGLKTPQQVVDAVRVVTEGGGMAREFVAASLLVEESLLTSWLSAVNLPDEAQVTDYSRRLMHAIDHTINWYDRNE